MKVGPPEGKSVLSVGRLGGPKKPHIHIMPIRAFPIQQISSRHFDHFCSYIIGCIVIHNALICGF
jgi:hypothetical protein